MNRFAKASVVAVIGVVFGVTVFVGIRMIMAKNTAPHYHANFAVYVDGQRLKFEGPTFYEEEAACSAIGSADPKTRAHMHDNIADTIHIHDSAVTWSDFFSNLRYGLSDKALTLDDKVLVDGQDGKHLRFILNGKLVSSVAGKVINSEDVLLISFGDNDTPALMKQSSSIDKSAHTYNTTADPAACSGAKSLTLSERFKRAVNVNY